LGVGEFRNQTKPGPNWTKPDQELKYFEKGAGARGEGHSSLRVETHRPATGLENLTADLVNFRKRLS
jgi:hypothetical protein